MNFWMPDMQQTTRERPSERQVRTLSVLVPIDLAQQMIDHCRKTGVGMAPAVTEALRTYLRLRSAS